MSLWSKNGGPLQQLPFQDAMPDGTMYTDLANNPEGRAALGWAQSDVPEVVSRMQLRRQLLRTAAKSGLGAGETLLDQVDAGVAASSDRDLKEYWANTSEFHRSHPKVAAFLEALGVSAAEADAAWAAAALLT
jgi:hypothetical protein